MKAALGIDQVIVVFPVIVLKAVFQVTDGPVVSGVPADVEIRDCILPQVTSISDGPHIDSCSLNNRFEVGELRFLSIDVVVFIRTLFPGCSDSVNDSLAILGYVEYEGSGC